MSFSVRYPQLQDNPLLGGLTVEEQSGLVEHAEILPLARGECAYQQGENAKRLGFVISGSLKLFRLTQDGQEKVFRILLPGDILAEGMLFSINAIHDYTAMAVETSEVLMFPLEQYHQIILNNSALSIALLSRLAQLEQDSLETLEILSFNKSVDRVVRYLVSQGLGSCNDCMAPKFELPATKRLIASQLSIQPETLSRVLNQLERDGLLLLEGRRICILDLPTLLQHG